MNQNTEKEKLMLGNGLYKTKWRFLNDFKTISTGTQAPSTGFGMANRSVLTPHVSIQAHHADPTTPSFDA